ncbi:G:T/U-mismatch repair DNA glycosylase [Bradyrhizobium japonicum]
METLRETHPYNLKEPIPEGTRILIVGTAPPPRFSNPNCREVGANKLDFAFFYGSGDNYFWKWIDEIGTEQGTPLPSEEAEPEEYSAAARIFLRRHNIWMKDVLQTYQRKRENPCGATDGSLERPLPEDCTNFLQVLKEHPSINSVVFTSELACEWTFMAMRDEKIAQSYRSAIRSRKAQEEGKTGDEYLDLKCREPFYIADINGRRVRFFIAISPSQRAGSKRGLREDHKRELYKRLLFSVPRSD